MIGVNDEWGLVYIYCIYYVENDVYFMGVPDEDSGFLYPFKQRDLRITDRSITFDMVYWGSDGRVFFTMLHWALAENELLDRVVERDDDALELFAKLRWANRRPD